MATSPDDLDFRRSLAHAIVAKRTEENWTQEHVARAIDVPLSVYRSWERERAIPRGAAFYRLCVLFNWPHVLRIESASTGPNGWMAQVVPDLAVSVLAPPAEAASTVNTVAVVSPARIGIQGRIRHAPPRVDAVRPGGVSRGPARYARGHRGEYRHAA